MTVECRIDVSGGVTGAALAAGNLRIWGCEAADTVMSALRTMAAGMPPGRHETGNPRVPRRPARDAGDRSDEGRRRELPNHHSESFSTDDTQVYLTMMMVGLFYGIRCRHFDAWNGIWFVALVGCVMSVSEGASY